MTPARLLRALDDAINPIVVKELRQALQSRFVTACLGLVLLAQLLMIVNFANRAETQVRSGGIDYVAGRRAFDFAELLLLGACLACIPASMGLRLCTECAQGSDDVTLLSRLRPHWIITSKLITAFLLTILITSLCAPLLVYSYLLRDVSSAVMMRVVFFNFIATLGCTQAAVLLGTIPGNRPAQTALVIAGFLLLLILGSTVFGAARDAFDRVRDKDSFLVASDASNLTQRAMLSLFWLAPAFSWSVSLVNPRLRDRARPTQFFALGVWLALLVALSYTAHTMYEGLGIWELLNVALCPMILLVAARRSHLRTHPLLGAESKAPQFRPVASLIGNELAQTIACAVAIATLSLVLGFWWPPMLGPTARQEVFVDLRTMGFLVLGILCYALSAAVVGRIILPVSGTTWCAWIASAGLVAIMCAIPITANLLFASGYRSDFPFPSFLPEFISRRGIAALPWGFLLISLCSPWFFMGMRRAEQMAVEPTSPSIAPSRNWFAASEVS